MRKISQPKETAAKRPADVVPRVYEVLRNKAINYALKPGERVNEIALAEELKVSRTPIREALNRLISEGMMTFIPNKGFYRLPLDIAEITNLFEVRRSIEAAAARHACMRAPDEGIAALADYWAGVKGRGLQALSIAEVASCDEAFHEKLVALSGNAEYGRLIAMINARIRFVRCIALENPRYGTVPDRAKAGGIKADAAGSLREHESILTALARRDADACAAALEGHIHLSLEDAMALLKEGLGRIYLGTG